MRIVILLENTSVRDGIAARHGLSIYIETSRHRILFDTGPDDSILPNAAALDVDLSQVDTAVLSHGHYDHGGGIDAFCQCNTTAPLYVRPGALDDFRSLRADGHPHHIGLPLSARQWTSRMRQCSVTERLDDELTLFSGIRGNLPLRANQRLRRCQDGEYLPDDFQHEQNLLVQSDGISVLFAGCAHSGILPILRRCTELLGHPPDWAFGGFHLHSPGTSETEPAELIRQIGAGLAAFPTRYYTGHCTGSAAYQQLREILGDQLQPMHAGMTFHL